MASLRLPLCAGWFWGCCLAGSAWAQPVEPIADGSTQPRAATEDERALPAVTVSASPDDPDALPPVFAGGQVARGGRLGLLGNTDVMSAPFNLTSYTAELLENQQARSVTDAIANDPSVRSSVSGGSFYEPLTLRGFGLGASDIAFMGLYGLMPISRTSVEFAERVDVIKGPAAMLTGMAPTGAIGGTVSITPKRAGEQPLSRLTVGADSQARLGVHADVGRRFGPDNAVGLRVNGVVRGGEGAVRDEDRRAGLGAVALDYRGERLRLSLDAYAQRQEQDGGGYGFSAFKNLALLPYYRIPDPARPISLGQTAEMRDKMAMVAGEFDISPSATVFARYGKHRTDVIAQRTLMRNLDINGSHVAALTVQNSKGIFGTGEIGARASMATGPVHHRWVVSLSDYDHDSFYAGYVPPDRDYLSSNIYAPTRMLAPRVWPTDRRKNVATRLRSLAVADTLSMLDDHLLLTLGVRRQQVAVDNFGANGAVTTRYDERATTPVVGLVVKPAQNISLYANYVEGLTRGPTAPTGTGLSNAGEVFPPYKSKQYELGAKGEWNGWGASASLYQIARPNTLTENNRFSVDGEQRNRGLELNVYGELARGLRLLGGVSLMNAKITRGPAAILGHRAFGIPKQQANLGVEWDAPFAPGLTLNARVLHTGSVYLNNTNTVSIPRWTRWDVGVRYLTSVAGKAVTLRANVENVAGKAYWMASDIESWVSLSAPRSVMLSASVDF